VPTESFGVAREIANRIAVGHLLTRKLELADANRARLEQERAKLERFYEYKERAARDKLDSVERTLRRLEASESPEERRILPVWQKNLEDARRRVDQLGEERDRRLRDLIGRDEVSASNQLIAASFVEIVPREAHPEA
jgi:hypothetical protein